ncbi:MAG TPA: TolC family protein [Vicinamibacterales bacterium]|nr:TolC family protein [Vicinamibacterales bacterium]
MRYQRFLRAFAPACLLICLPVSAFAQTGQLRFDAAALAAAAQSATAQPQAGQATATRRLSMDEAVKLALEQNLGIRIQRIDPQIQDVGIMQARSFWAPSLSSGLSRQTQTQQSTSALAGSTTTIDNANFATQVALNQALPWGANYNAFWNNSRTTTNNLFVNFVPQINSTLQLQYTQPFVRNRSIDQIRQQVLNSKKARDLSDIQLASVITQTSRSVRNAYWDLVFAINNLKAQQQSLALSQQFLKDNQKRVEIGTLAPIDIVQAQAEVASNESGVIVAEAAIKTAQDNLRTLIMDPGQPDFWTTEFDPSDAASFSEQTLDVDAAVRNALSKRSDILSAKNSLEQSDVNLKYYHNQLLPDVNGQLTYNATAAGGTQLSSVSLANLAAPRSVVSDSGFGSVLGNVLQSQYPTWTVGIQVAYPLGASTAQANMARARLQYEQAQTQMKALEMNVATQVRLAARNVNTNQKRVLSARASRELQEKKLDAEEKKLAAGMSQSFFVFQAQRDLAQARVVEIQAIADYNKSLVDFETVQEVPLNGGSGGITTAGSGAVQAGGSAIVRAQ